MAVIESTTDGILCDVSIKPQTVSASFLSMKSTSANLLGTMEKYCSYPPWNIANLEELNSGT